MSGHDRQQICTTYIQCLKTVTHQKHTFLWPGLALLSSLQCHRAELTPCQTIHLELSQTLTAQLLPQSICQRNQLNANVYSYSSDQWQFTMEQAVGGRPPRYASAPCKLTISSYLFARWHLFWHMLAI